MTIEPRAIGILAPQLSGDYFGTLFTGIHAVTRRYSPRLVAVQGTPADLGHTRLALDHVDGWIVINSASGIDTLAGANIPAVTIGTQAPGYTAIFPDNYAGMHSATLHLAEHGHRRIAFIGDLEHDDVKQRYAGYRAGLAEQGIEFDPALVVTVPNTSEQSGAIAARRLLDGDAAWTAVVVATDENALGVLATIQEAGKRIPDDIAVIGFGDIILAQSTSPPLTTVRMPIRALGAAAAEELLAQLGGKTPSGEVGMVPTMLIPRRSCGCSITMPTPEALGRAGDWRSALAGQLAQLATYPATSESETPLTAIWPGGERLIDAVVDTLQNDTSIDSAVLYQAWREFVDLTENAEALLAALALLEAAAVRQIADLPPDATRPARLDALFARIRLEMLRARLGIETDALRAYANLVAQNSAIGHTLLSAQNGAAQQLQWLRQTPLSWGCLGLWADPVHGAGTMLTVAGSYAQNGRPAAPHGRRYPAASFPPADLIPDSVHHLGTEIVMLLPIRTQTHNWGVLALTGTIQYLRSSGNYDALGAIATLLGTAMESDVLDQTLRQAYERERGLADIVRQLGSPVIPLMPAVLLVPLVGMIDTARAQQIISAVLEGVTNHQATTVLLDISGVPLVDMEVANSLIRTAQAANLLGARVFLIGVRPEIAQSIVETGIDLRNLSIQPTLAAAVQRLLQERRPRSAA